MTLGKFVPQFPHPEEEENDMDPAAGMAMTAQDVTQALVAISTGVQFCPTP